MDLSLEFPLIEDTSEIFIIGLLVVLIDKVYIIDISRVYKRRRFKYRLRLVLVN